MPRPVDDIPSPLDRRLVFVTGKGGVGKSTVAAALGLIGARHGRRTIVAELARRDDISRALADSDAPAESPEYSERELSTGLWQISIDPELAMEEYLIDQLPVRALADRLSSSRTFSHFAAATPGLREVVAIGKVWELAQAQRHTEGASPYDLVIVDAPATGHGLALLAAPRVMAAATGVGPVARQARTIQAMLSDPEITGAVVVALPTEAAVAETLALREGIARELGLGCELVINSVETERFAAADDLRLAAAQRRLDGHSGQPAATALRAARAQVSRVRAQQAPVSQLRTVWDGPAAVLPALFAAQLGPEQIATLAAILEAQLRGVVTAR